MFTRRIDVPNQPKATVGGQYLFLFYGANVNLQYELTVIFELEVIHDKIPNGSMTSHDFDDLFCNFG